MGSQGPDVHQGPFTDVGGKADQLDREDSQPRRSMAKEKNFPPLPSFCCVGPCFYHDISVDIPIESQKICRIMFHLWQFHVFCLFFNCIGGLAALCVGFSNGTMFGLGIMYLVLFTPMSFVLWYRPIYKALKNDSSFNYMVFFFIFFVQIIVVVIFAIGISSVGTCGWINAVAIVNSSVKGRIGVSVVFFISSILFTLLAIFKILALRKIHTAYRRSGASLQKAQSEFSNESVRQAQGVVEQQHTEYKAPSPFA